PPAPARRHRGPAARVRAEPLLRPPRVGPRRARFLPRALHGVPGLLAAHRQPGGAGRLAGAPDRGARAGGGAPGGVPLRARGGDAAAHRHLRPRAHDAGSGQPRGHALARRGGVDRVDGGLTEERMRYRKGAMIVAAQPEATEAGADILKAGGNAVDAAVACALVAGVVDPMMCGIAGFGSCGIFMPATGFHGYIDFHAPAPLAVRPDMWADLIESEARDGYGFILRGRVNDIGYQSICAPASLRAYRDAHREHRRLPWEQIVEPAIAWAEGGWTVRPHVGYFWADEGQMGRAPSPERLAYTPAGRALYCRPDGMPKRVGDRVVNRDLGQVLRLVAKQGDAV